MPHGKFKAAQNINYLIQGNPKQYMELGLSTSI